MVGPIKRRFKLGVVGIGGDGISYPVSIRLCQSMTDHVDLVPAYTNIVEKLSMTSASNSVFES